MPVRRAESAGWARARSPTSEGGREGREGTVDSLKIDQREGLGVWRRSQRAIRSTDPGRSAWWVALRIIGAVLGAITPFIVKPGMPWPVLGVLALVGSLLSQPVISALQDWASKRAQDRRTAESSESSEIYDSLVGKELKGLRVHHSDHDDSEFLTRDAQKKLIQNIEDRTPTLIVGPSMSGKTRLVVETVRKNYPSTPVCFPKGDDDIQHLIDAPQSRRRGSIIILDDVDRFLSNQTLSLGQLNMWIRESCIVIATMMKSSYIPWRDGAKDKLPGWDVVNRFTIIQMGTLLTENEQVALSNSRYADLAAVEKVGLAPLLGGAPKVRQRLEEGREQHLWGYALVRAAADWRRAGLGPATKTQIQEVALVFKDDIAWGKPNWKKAWKWASEKTNDTVSLIRQTGSREWEVLDLVADEADWPLSQQTLEAMAGTEHSSRQAFAISLTMYMRGVLDDNKPVVKQILQEADKFLYEFTFKSTPDSDLFGLYAVFLMDVRRDYDRAEAMYERAINADSTNTNIRSLYADFLENIRHDYDRAEAIKIIPARIDSCRLKGKRVDMARSYTGTVTFARFDLLQLQVIYLLREAGGTSSDSIKKIKTGLVEPHYIDTVRVLGVFDNGHLGAELRFEIDWREHDAAIKTGGSHLQAPNTWTDGVAVSVSEATATFLDACERARLQTEWMVCYGQQYDRDKVNQLLGVTPVDVRKWGRCPDQLKFGFGQLTEASMTISLAI